MRDVVVPPAPTTQAAPPAQPEQQTTSEPKKAPRTSSPLDAHFLSRVYRSMAITGVIATALAYFLWSSAAHLSSFAGGYFLALLLLRAQEVVVRGLLRPKEQLAGMDPRLGVLLLLPLKFVAVAAVLVAFNMSGFLKPIPMAAGFFVAQLVVIARVIGWTMTRNRA